VAAATRIAHEDGDVRILKALLKRYRNTNIILSNEILQDIDIRLQHGPSYIQESYRCFVEKIFNQTLMHSTNESEDWASYSEW
jgi:hypothetical protein